jgi:hypothetical protein
MEEYKQEIRELVEKITPTTPPEVRSEREDKSIEQTTHFALEVNEIEDVGCGAKIADLIDFEGYMDPVKGRLGFCSGFMGSRPMGFSHV